MPQINLLVPGSKKKVLTVASVKEPMVELKEIAPAVIPRSLIFLGVGILIWVVLVIGVSRNERILLNLEEKVKVLSANPKEIQRLKNERAALEKKVKLIDKLSSRKFLWFEKFRLIATLIPDGVWLTDIYSKEEKITAREPATGDNNQSTDLGEKTILVIKGTAVANTIQDAVSLVGDFIKNLQANQDFSKDFAEIKLNTATKTTIGGMDVMRFDFLCEAK